MFKAVLSANTAHNFLMQGNNIIIFSDGAPITSDMLRAVRNSCTTTDYFSEPNLSYSALMIGDNVDIKSVALSMATTTGVLHNAMKIPLREYFALCLSTCNKKDAAPSPTAKNTNNGDTATSRANTSCFSDISNSNPYSAFSYSDNENCALAARAHSLILWRRNMKYCSICAGELCDSRIASSRVCVKCAAEYFPRLEPCVIVRITKGDEILLARHTYRNQDVYTCVAGFIEAGETAENAVYREVYEEVHLRIKNVKYLKSQSWPFPDQLMLAFSAEYESGDILLQQDEIADARWFSMDDLPPTPRVGSVAYSIIHYNEREN